MGDITKERPLLVFLNERNRFVGDDFRQQGLIKLIRNMSHRLVLLHHRERFIRSLGDGIAPLVLRPHIIGIRNAKIGVEPLGKGHEFGLVSQMPLAKATGGVAVFSKHFCDGNFVRV